MMIMIDMTSQLIEYTAYFGTLYFSYHAAEFLAKVYEVCYIHGNHTCKNAIEVQYKASLGMTMYENEKGNKNL